MNRSKQIQGLRALAVILVLLFHADWVPGGYIGVDVFYVISGYLITNLIVSDKDFSFSKFYARRAKRLLPAAYLVLAVTGFAYWLIGLGIAKLQFAKDLFAATWYFSNFSFAYWQNDYQNLGAQPSPLIHYWSLAVEEQFYLVWPVLLFLFRRRLKPMILVVSALSFLTSPILITIAPIWAFYSLPTRAFELGIGAFLAISKLKSKVQVRGSSLRIAPGLVSWILIALLVGAALLFDENTYFPGVPALVPTLIAACLIAMLTLDYRNVLLESAIFQKIGDWSYSIYLWHWPLLIIPEMALARRLTTYEKFAVLSFCILLGGATYRYFENPIRIRQISNRIVFLFTFFTALTLSFLAFLIYQDGQKISEKIDLENIRRQPIIYIDGCQLDKAAVAPRSDCIYGDKSAKRSVVLLGDSHAAQWFPAVDKWANLRSYRLIVMTKSSCPAAALSLRDKSGFKASNCREFQTVATREIKRLDPELLIVGSAENHKFVDAKEYLKLPEARRILVIKDTPWPNQDIPTCISKFYSNSGLIDGSKCAIDRPSAISYPGYETFDPLPLLCDSMRCSSVVDGVVAYRDHSHISVAMALALYPKLAEKLDKVVAG